MFDHILASKYFYKSCQLGYSAFLCFFFFLNVGGVGDPRFFNFIFFPYSLTVIMSVLKTENQLVFCKSAVIFYNEELLGVGKCVAIAIFSIILKMILRKINFSLLQKVCGLSFIIFIE